MKLIVGLGNPGKEYSSTRHNVGFLCIDHYAKKHKIEIDKKKFNGLYNTLNINGEKIILLKPQMYINLSGNVIKKFMDYFSINIDDLLVINDDLDLNVGTIKLKASGSSGGHNGLKNIEQNLETTEYKRLKIGISNDKNVPTIDYVVGKFSCNDNQILKELFNITDNLLDDFILISFENLMNVYNRK